MQLSLADSTKLNYIEAIFKRLFWGCPDLVYSITQHAGPKPRAVTRRHAAELQQDVWRSSWTHCISHKKVRPWAGSVWCSTHEPWGEPLTRRVFRGSTHDPAVRAGPGAQTQLPLEPATNSVLFVSNAGSLECCPWGLHKLPSVIPIMESCRAADFRMGVVHAAPATVPTMSGRCAVSILAARSKLASSQPTSV